MGEVQAAVVGRDGLPATDAVAAGLAERGRNGDQGQDEGGEGGDADEDQEGDGGNGVEELHVDSFLQV